MEYLTQCPVCSGENFNFFLRTCDFTVTQEEFDITACAGCGFRFTNPRPSEEEIGRFYRSEEYISHSNTRKGLINMLYQWVRHYTIRQKFNLVNNCLIRSGGDKISLLDIGCGTGEFLLHCKKRGWDVTGIEPGEEAAEYARNIHGLNVYGLGELDRFVPETYNAITLWHVLEHIHKLDETLTSIRKVIKKEGVLILALPNCNSHDAREYGEYWAAYDVPRHLYHFSPVDVERLMKRGGFELKQILPMRFDSYYVSLLSEKYKGGNFLNGLFNGLKSNLTASKSGKRWSSQIYVFLPSPPAV